MTKEQRKTFRWHVLDYWSWIFRTATAAGVGATIYHASDLDTAVEFITASIIAGLIGMALMYWRDKL